MSTLGPTLARAFVTVGVFDGVHLGHQDLIHQMVTEASADHCMSCCITFDPHPEVVVHPERQLLALCDIEERLQLIREQGADDVRVIPFTPAVALQTPEEFIAMLAQTLEVCALWVGPDFALGRDRTGTINVLRAIGEERGFKVELVAPILRDQRPISSSWVREALASGDVRLATSLLGRPYSLSGQVVAGMRRGRELGFPTANVMPPAGRALPSDGVYFVEAFANASFTGGQFSEPTWHGVVNLGARPTFGEAERILETHLLDFSGDLYDARLTVCFKQRLRGVERFSGIDELRAQIARDIKAARQLALAARSA